MSKNIINISGDLSISSLSIPSTTTTGAVAVYGDTTGNSLAQCSLTCTGGNIDGVNSLTITNNSANPTGNSNTLWVNSANELQLGDSPVGGGDVVGPASAGDNAIVRFDGTTGKLIQSSQITIPDSVNGILSGAGWLAYIRSGDNCNVVGGDFSGSGDNNVCVGVGAGSKIRFTSNRNICVGNGSMGTGGSLDNRNDNISIGTNSGYVSGNNNILIGTNAGSNIGNWPTVCSDNICLGSAGVLSDNGVIRIGTSQTQCFIKGIRDVSVSSGEMVVVDADGKLGSEPIPGGYSPVLSGFVGTFDNDGTPVNFSFTYQIVGSLLHLAMDADVTLSNAVTRGTIDIIAIPPAVRPKNRIVVASVCQEFTGTSKACYFSLMTDGTIRITLGDPDDSTPSNFASGTPYTFKAFSSTYFVLI